jgi:CPA2 family monovalent cation:H+ antiporter-2
MENIDFIRDLAMVLAAAAGMAVLFYRIHQPPVLGYLLAGLIVGPHTPSFASVSNPTTLRIFADLGIILLMFTLGLEFNSQKLRKVGATAVFTACFDVAILLWLGYSFGRMMGWSAIQSLFLGAIICDSSTTILAKILKDLGWGKRKFADLVVGITLVEDVLAVVLIAALTGLGAAGTLPTRSLLISFGGLLVFMISLLVVGWLILPGILGWIKRFHSDELIVVSLMGLCFTIAVIAVKLQYSIALGAFILGFVISEAGPDHRIENLMMPLRHLFSAIFFVAIGMMIDPDILIAHAGLILPVTALVIFGKIAANTTGCLLVGESPGTSLRTGIAMAQIGEFAYLIAALGLTLGLTQNYLFQVAISVSALTTLINVQLLRHCDPIVNWVGTHTSPRLHEALAMYGRWLGTFSHSYFDNPIRKSFRRSMLIIAINTALIAGIFFAFSRVAWHWPSLPVWIGGSNALLWLAASLIASPLYVANIRKIQALGMLLSELCVPASLRAGWARSVRALIANTVLLLGLVCLGLITLFLSATFLPSPAVLTVIIIAVLIIMWARWRTLSRIYSLAQSTVFRRMGTGPETTPPVSGQASKLLNLHMESIAVAPTSSVAYQRLADIGLRTRTGANAVSIERAGTAILSPGPDEILRPDDRVFLVGRPDQIAAAKQLLDPA